MYRNHRNKASNYTEDGFDRQKELEPIHNENRVFWNETLGRSPLAIKEIYYLTTLEEVNWACDEIMHDPYFPGVFGIDGEFISDNIEYSKWVPPGNFPAPFPNFYFLAGNFCRMLQLARCDGTCYIVDLYMLKKFPNSLFTLLTDENVIKFGFAWRADALALNHVYGKPVEDPTPFSLIGLSKKAKKQLRNSEATLFVREEDVLDVQTTYSTLKCNPAYRCVLRNFCPKNISFHDFVLEAFGVEIPKAKAWCGKIREWDIPAYEFTNAKEEYACKDALGALDVGLYFRILNLWNSGEPVNQVLAEISRQKLNAVISNIKQRHCVYKEVHSSKPDFMFASSSTAKGNSSADDSDDGEPELKNSYAENSDNGERASAANHNYYADDGEPASPANRTDDSDDGEPELKNSYAENSDDGEPASPANDNSYADNSDDEEPALKMGKFY